MDHSLSSTLILIIGILFLVFSFIQISNINAYSKETEERRRRSMEKFLNSEIKGSSSNDGNDSGGGCGKYPNCPCGLKKDSPKGSTRQITYQPKLHLPQYQLEKKKEMV